MDCSDSSCHCHVFAFRTEIDTGWYLFLVELLEQSDRFWFLYKIPFIDIAVLAWNNESVGGGLDGGADDRCHNGLEKNGSFFALFINFLKLWCFQERNSGIVINNNKIITGKIFIIFKFIITNSALCRLYLWFSLLLKIREWDGMNGT
jgi:hypothetical protein